MPSDLHISVFIFVFDDNSNNNQTKVLIMARALSVKCIHKIFSWTEANLLDVVRYSLKYITRYIVLLSYVRVYDILHASIAIHSSDFKFNFRLKQFCFLEKYIKKLFLIKYNFIRWIYVLLCKFFSWKIFFSNTTSTVYWQTIT